MNELNIYLPFPVFTLYVIGALLGIKIRAR